MAPLIPTLILLVPLGSIVAILAAYRHARLRLFILLAMATVGLLLSAALVVTETGRLYFTMGGWQAPYGIALAVDGLSRVMLLLTDFLFLIALLYQAGQELGRSQTPGRLTSHLVFPLLIFALHGLFLTADFFNFYVFFELAAVSSYLLVAMGRHHALEAAWKYAIQSILSSAALLSAIAFIYGVTGSLNMADVAQKLSAPLTWLAPFILTAFLVKSALFPFHWWQPDAYAAASTAGSVLLSGTLANVGIYGLLRFWPLLLGDTLRWPFLWIGAASILFGGLAAWREADAKRVLAFSSISQLGFVLLAMGWSSTAAQAAAVLFLVHHALSKSLLFLSMGWLADRHSATRLEDLAGRGANEAWSRGAFLLGFLSLVGLPPATGFAGKLAILSAGFSLAAWPWVGVVLTGTLLTLAYGYRAFETLFWRQGAPAGAGRQGRSQPSSLAHAAMGALMLVLVGAGLLGRPLWFLAFSAAEALQKGAPP